MKNRSRLPESLYVLTGVLAGATLALWLLTGAHLGWTQTSITTMEHDAVTGIDYPVRQKKFIAGVEVLAAGAAAAGVLGTTGLILQRRRNAAA